MGPAPKRGVLLAMFLSSKQTLPTVAPLRVTGIFVRPTGLQEWRRDTQVLAGAPSCDCASLIACLGFSLLINERKAWG